MINEFNATGIIAEKELNHVRPETAGNCGQNQTDAAQMMKHLPYVLLYRSIALIPLAVILLIAAVASHAQLPPVEVHDPFRNLPAASSGDDWYQGRVSFIFLTDSGHSHVALTPSPNDEGFTCGGAVRIVPSDHSSIDEDEQLWIEGQLLSLFTEALTTQATVSVFLEHRTSSSGNVYCIVQRVQVWNDGRSTSNAGGGNSGGGNSEIAYYGAFALGDDALGAAIWNARSQADADADALSDCRTQTANCRIVARFGPRMCIAAAKDVSTGAVGWAVDSNLSSARNRALALCRDGRFNCVVEIAGCNGVDPNSTGMTVTVL